jgi:integrase
MASVFKRNGKNGRKSPCWTIQYIDAHGKSRQKKGFTDKQESQRLANKLEHEAKLRRDGLIDPAAEELATQTKRCAVSHLDEFLGTIRSKGRTEKHVKLISTRIRAVLDEAGIATPSEITHDRVEKAIVAIQNRDNLSPRTVNHYIQAVKEFVAWLVPRRLGMNPLLDLELRNTEVDIRKKRRALTQGEMSQLVEATRASTKSYQCYTGEQRARIYLVSYLTGLRKNEIASLTPESFRLDDQTPTLTLEARHSKHRKQDVLPLHPQLVDLLQQWLPEYPPGEPLFPKLGKRKAYLMIRKDLEAAGIPYTTQDGDADFHAAGRHTYITELLRNGTSLVVARELARHSDVKMTMRYTHIGLQDQAKGIQNLPTDPRWLETRRLTESKSQHISSSSQHICSKSGVCEGQSESPTGSDCHSNAAQPADASDDDVSPYDTHGQNKAPPVTDGALMEAAGIEPEDLAIANDP